MPQLCPIKCVSADSSIDLWLKWVRRDSPRLLFDLGGANDPNREQARENSCFLTERWFKIILVSCELKEMRQDKRRAVVGLHFFIGVLLVWGMTAYSSEPEQILEPKPNSGKVFLYTARKFGVPILRASIKIENGFSEQGMPLYYVFASVDSSRFGFLFRMNNRFRSTIQAETFSPVRYVKEIDQEGLLIGRKNYLQTFTFDLPNKKVVAEKGEKKEREEFPIPYSTYDPLSMFAKYYLKEEIHPGQDIPMSIFDGVKLRQMIFYSKKGKVISKRYGEVDAVCLESNTSFSSFEDKEGKIRIWYTTHGEKTPILIELELPAGHIESELESVEKR